MKAKLTCPKCGFCEEIEVPEKACLAFHNCKNCRTTITPKENSCCVICSYSDKKCHASEVE